MTTNPLDGFQVHKEDIQTIGNDLQRPECILAEPDGTLWSADARGGVMRISSDGSQQIVTQSYQKTFETQTGRCYRTGSPRERCPTDWPLQKTVIC